MRSKNSKLTLPTASKPAGNPFFKNSLKVLLLIALLQLGATLFVLVPHFIEPAAKLLPQKSSILSISPTSGFAPKKVTTPLPLTEDLKSHSGTVSKADSPLLAGNNLQPGASLSIIDIRHTQGSLGEQALKIAIKSQTQELISIPDVKVQVYFYDQQGEEIIPSKAPVTSRWLRSPVEWKNGEPEILEVIYQPESVSSDLYYVGYVVAVYYKGELQSYRADPVKLTTQFPIKVFIGPNEL